MAKAKLSAKQIQQNKEKESKERDKQLKKAMKQVNREYGTNTVIPMGSDKAIMHIDTIPTGSLALDYAIGIGGYPRGRVVDIAGPESSGKTTLALEAVAEVQKRGGRVFYLDTENALHAQYAQKLGVDINKLIVSQPRDAEQGLQITKDMVKTGAIDLVVIDSVAALTPRAEIQDNMGDQHIALLARSMSKFLRDVSSLLNKTNTCCIMINQLRDKLGSFVGGAVQPGGRALKFYSSVMIKLSLGHKLKKGTTIIGREPFVQVKKNKVAPPFRQCKLEVKNGTDGTYGIDKMHDLIAMGKKAKVIEQAGAFYSYQGHNIGQGAQKAEHFLATHQDVRNEIAVKICKAYGMKVPSEFKSTNAPTDDSTAKSGSTKPATKASKTTTKSKAKSKKSSTK